MPPHQLFDSQAGQWIWRQILREKGGSLSDELGQILDKMLTEALKDRYQSAAEVLQAVNSRSGQGVTQVSLPVTMAPTQLLPATTPPPQSHSQPPDEISKLLETVKTELSQAQPEKPSSPNYSGLAKSSSPASKSPVLDPIEADLQALKAEFGEES